MKSLLSVMLLLTWTYASGQIKFEAGYFVGNDGQRTNCEIKNQDWANNPTSFQYRIGAGEGTEKTISDVSEFGFNDGTIYRRFTVDIDRTSDDISRLTKNRNPEFKSETLFLRVLVPGKSTLYGYEDRGLKRFFYQMDQGTVQQLVYLRFLGVDKSGKWESGYAEANNQYKQQLFNDLKCADIQQKDIENLNYDRSSLMKLFKGYNKCQGGTGESVELEKTESTTHITPRAGVAYNGFSVSDASGTTKLDNAMAWKLGVQVEFVIPSNKGLWSVTFEPSFESFSTQNSSKTIKLDYKAIDLAVALRRYLILETNRGLYINAGFVYALPISGKEALTLGGLKLDVGSGVNVTAGLGYRINKISAEVYYGFGRGLLGDYANYNSNYSGPGILLGYRIR